MYNTILKLNDFSIYYYYFYLILRCRMHFSIFSSTTTFSLSFRIVILSFICLIISFILHKLTLNNNHTPFHAFFRRDTIFFFCKLISCE